MTLLGIPLERRQILLGLGDVLVAFTAVYLAHALRFEWIRSPADLFGILDASTGASVTFLGSNLLLLYVADAYQTSRDWREPREILRLWLAVAGAFVVQMACFYAIPDWGWGRGIAGLAALSFGVLLTTWRCLVSRFHPGPVTRWRALIVGAGSAAAAIADVIRGNREHGEAYDLQGFVDDGGGQVAGLLRLGLTADLVETVEQRRVRLLIIARQEMPPSLVEALLRCKARGVRIVDVPTLYKRLTGKVPVRHVTGSWLLLGSGYGDEDRVRDTVLRLLDLGLGLVGAVAALPLLALSALLVKATSPGPVIFTQTRLGRNGRPFTLFKLRTMVHGAEDGTGAVWSAGPDDPRVTPVGRLLRRTRLDEIPQLWNVIRGDMSVIGPRPERPEFVAHLERDIPFYGLRFSVKPGLTGWAQVNFRYGATVDDAIEKLAYELYAIQEMGPVLYLLILLKTLQTVLVRPGW